MLTTVSAHSSARQDFTFPFYDSFTSSSTYITPTSLCTDFYLLFFFRKFLPTQTDALFSDFLSFFLSRQHKKLRTEAKVNRFFISMLIKFEVLCTRNLVLCKCLVVLFSISMQRFPSNKHRPVKCVHTRHGMACDASERKFRNVEEKCSQTTQHKKRVSDA